MKRAIAILLFAVFLFNVGGYYLMFWALRAHSSRAMISRLDEHRYSDKDEIKVSIPLALPYGLNRDAFTRANAIYEKDGNYYRLVEYSYHQDTLHIVYVKDHDQKRLADTLRDYAKETNSQPLSHQGMSLLAKLLTDFESTSIISFVGVSGWSRNLRLPAVVFDMPVCCQAVITPPPKS